MDISDISRLGNKIVVSLAVNVPCEIKPRVHLVPRHKASTIIYECKSIAGGFEATIEQIDAAICGRWDVWLDIPGRRKERLGWSAAEIRPGQRHLVRERIGEYGFAAYLTESQGSLAIYVDLAHKHASVCDDEQAKQDFTQHLDSLPVLDNLVLFESFLGKAYAGNPRYIYECLYRSRKDLRYVWAYNGRTSIPGEPEIVRRGSADYYRLLAQARYRVNNIRFPVLGKQAGTTYLQTWHGTPLKRLGFDIEAQGPEIDARESLHQESQGWDLLLSESRYCSEVLVRAFKYHGEVIELGYPLTDALLNEPCPSVRRLRRLGLPAGKRYILYAPTWRDDKQIAPWQHSLDLNLDLQLLEAHLPDDCILLIKAHHLVAETLDPAILPINVVDMSHVEDINDLCAVAAVLITDYSSVLFDFAVTGRPILLYCYDLDTYANQTRGLYLDIAQDLPGPVATTTVELLQMIANIEQITGEYADRYVAFQHRFCSLNDGQVSARVAKAVFGAAPHD